MGILINSNTNVIFQGFTGKQGSLHSQKALEYGTKVVAGVTPGKGSQTHIGKPVFNSVAEVLKNEKVDASIIFVPAPHCKDAILEAIDAKIKTIVCITEGIPTLDMLEVKYYLNDKPTMLIGPNCPGIITPNECLLGIMPTSIYKKGSIGVVSRSGTLTYEACKQIIDVNLGQSTCVGIGGDPILGSDFVDILKKFHEDNATDAVVLIGEIGGCLEEEAAAYIKEKFMKPVVAYIAGRYAPKRKRMGHAGAIITGGAASGTFEEKWDALTDAGVKVVKSPSEIGSSLLKLNLRLGI